MIKKQCDQKSLLLPTNKSLMPTCFYANMYVSISSAYMLPTSTDNVFMLNVKSITVPSVPPVCLTTSVRNNVTKKLITYRDTVIKPPRNCLHKGAIVKNCNAVNYFSEPVNNALNCSRSFSTSSSDFVCQLVRLINLFINI